MEEEFIIRTLREGSVKSTPEIEDILNVMGCETLKSRFLGSVAAVVEKADGRITKQRLNWGADNNPKFNESNQRNADLLLQATVKAVEGGNDPSEMRIRFVAKM